VTAALSISIPKEISSLVVFAKTIEIELENSVAMQSRKWR
jgi:hypothetical protein